MSNIEVTDEEVIRILMDGGRRLCDHAEEQWISGKYGDDHVMRQENLARWRKIRSRISEIGQRIKDMPLN